MDIGRRLKMIASMVDKNSDCIADIGTDHGYIPVYLVKNGICEKAIASDINRGPLQKARVNIEIEGCEKKIECRLGEGLSTLKLHEADGIVIAGMGGNLIRDIIEDEEEIFKNLKFAVLQPAQNPEVLRKYVYESGYKIIDEDICIDDGIFYEAIKVRYDKEHIRVDSIFYEVSNILIQKKHPLIGKYIDLKIEKYDKILNSISGESLSVVKRKSEITDKVIKLKELKTCL